MKDIINALNEEWIICIGRGRLDIDCFSYWQGIQSFDRRANQQFRFLLAFVDGVDSRKSIFQFPTLRFVFRNRVLWPLVASEFQLNSSYISTALESDVLPVTWVRSWWGFGNPSSGEVREMHHEVLSFSDYFFLIPLFQSFYICSFPCNFILLLMLSFCLCLYFSLYLLYNCFSFVVFLYIDWRVSAYGETHPPGAESGGTIQL